MGRAGQGVTVMYQQVEPGYFSITTPVREYQLDHTRWWGQLRLTYGLEAPLHVGSGAVRLERFDDGSTDIVSDLVRAKRDNGEEVPVIPGSSIKGATRVVFEALTGSCDPFGRPCRSCAACQVFGSTGRRGLMGFGEARTQGSFKFTPTQIRQRFAGKSRSGRPDQQSVTRRFYRRAGEQSSPRDEEQLLCVAEGARFAGSLSVLGADAATLGALLIALGITSDIERFRVGAGKNRKLGFVKVGISAARIATSFAGLCTAADLSRGDLDNHIEEWTSAARDTFPDLQQVANELRDQYGEGG